MADGIRLSGFGEAADLLRTMPELAGDSLPDAVEKGAEPIRERASQLAPEDTGQLKDNIIVEGAKSHANVFAETKIGPNGAAWYGMFPELGTGRGWEGNAHPYLRPAADELWQEAAAIVADEIGDAIL